MSRRDERAQVWAIHRQNDLSSLPAKEHAFVQLKHLVERTLQEALLVNCDLERYH